MASFLGSLATSLGQSAGQMANIRAQEQVEERRRQYQLEREERAEYLREKWYDKEKADRLAAETRQNEEWDRRFDKQSAAALEQAKIEVGAENAENQVSILESRMAELDKQMKAELEATKSEGIGAEEDPSALQKRYNEIRYRYNLRKLDTFNSFAPETVQAAGYGGMYEEIAKTYEGIKSKSLQFNPATGDIEPYQEPQPEKPKPKKPSLLGSFANDLIGATDSPLWNVPSDYTNPQR